MHRERGNWGMLIRALLISILLHIVILLSASRLGISVRPVLSGPGASALEMRIGTRDIHESHHPKVSKQGIPDMKSGIPIRPSGSPPYLKAGHLNVGRNFRSTVEGAHSGSPESNRVDDVKSSDQLPVSAEELGQYRLNVARSARQFKVYPSLARESRWEGVVHVSVNIPVGMVGYPVVSLDRSSGYGVLDRQALEMVEQAVRLAIVPESMRGRSLSLSLPVEYRLADR